MNTRRTPGASGGGGRRGRERGPNAPPFYPAPESTRKLVHLDVERARRRWRGLTAAERALEAAIAAAWGETAAAWSAGDRDLARRHAAGVLGGFLQGAGMTAAALLDRLSGVRERGPANWGALCPGHKDRNPSLSIRETAEGAVLLHCFAGCSVEDVLDAIGLTFCDLYPPRLDDHCRRPRVPRLRLGDIIAPLSESAMVVWLAACMIERGEALSDSNLADLATATATINRMRDEIAPARLKWDR